MMMLPDGTVEEIFVDPETGEQRRVFRRPGLRTRAVSYPAYTAYEDVVLREGTRPIWLYLRLSKYHRDGQDAIERQRLDLHRKLAADGGWTIMGEFIDNDSASKSAIRTRKGWHALNSAIEAGEVTAVAFWKLDRTHRVASRCLEWIATCQARRVELVSHQDAAHELNSATAGAKLVTGIKALMAEVETDNMSERQRDAKQHAAEAGFNHGGTRPFGWMSGPKETDEHGRQGVRLVPHPVEFPALQDAVPMVIAGASLSEVSTHWMTKHGIVTADGVPMQVGNVQRVLHSPRMVGHRMRNVPEHQRGVKINLMDYVVRDENGEPIIAHTPVCEPGEWTRMLRALEAASTLATRRPWGSHEWLLTGLAHCGECNNRLYGAMKSLRGPDGEPIYRYWYRCQANRRKKPGTCEQVCSVRAEGAEAYVQGWLFAYVTDERLAKARAELEAARQATAPHSRLVKELDDVRQERDALKAQQGTDRFKGAMVGHLLGMIADVQERIDRLEAQLDAVMVEALPVTSSAELMAKWPAMDLTRRRRLLARVIETVKVQPGTGGEAEDRLEIIPRF